MKNPQQHGGEKAFLIIVSLAVGVGFGCWQAFDFRGPNPVLIDGGIWLGMFWTAAVSLVYTVVAGMVVSLCEGMKSIAYRGAVGKVERRFTHCPWRSLAAHLRVLRYRIRVLGCDSSAVLSCR
jgi:hypothetical protein